MQEDCTSGDELLVRKLVARDLLALGLLYDRYSGVSYSIAFRVTGDRQAAEEVLQNTFLRLWGSAEGLEAKWGSVPLFLITHARLLAISWMRAKNGQVCDCPDAQATTQALDPAWASLIETDARDIVVRVLSALSESQQRIVTLAYFEGFTCEEIAAHTGKTQDTVMSEMRTSVRQITAAIKASPRKFSSTIRSRTYRTPEI